MIPLRRLRALHEQGTAGPWSSDDKVIGWWSGEQPACRVTHMVTPSMSAPVAMCQVERIGGTDRPVQNAELIAAMRNALPDLLQAAESLETLRGMRERIEHEMVLCDSRFNPSTFDLLRDLLAVIAAEPSPTSPKATT